MPIDLASARRSGRVAAVLLLLGLTAQTDMSEPFGLATVPAPPGPLAATWARLRIQMKAERPVIARCRAAPLSCRSIPALQFIAIVDQGKDFHGLARIGHINRAVNFSIRAVAGHAPDATHDQWTAPLASLAAGEGDCKQYAVLKYAALQAAGLAADDLRIVIVKQRGRPQTHAVVAVRQAGRWLILDNRRLAMVEGSELLDLYVPLETLSRRGVRRFIGAPQVPREFGAACVG
ncbi:MAG: transglutaminase-like cysteine peptidase [Pseudolabrys sp.]